MRERWRDSVTDGETDENKQEKEGESCMLITVM